MSCAGEYLWIFKNALHVIFSSLLVMICAIWSMQKSYMWSLVTPAAIHLLVEPCAGEDSLLRADPLAFQEAEHNVLKKELAHSPSTA